jgi:methanogenic corrinoid protein MtbC1
VSGADISHSSVQEYLGYASGGEGQAGVRLALTLLDRGASIEDVIVNLLGAAQREAGKRWMLNTWSIADEHLVSGITQRALDAVANSMAPPASGSLVVVACAEGDWHSLPAQMLAEMLRSHGFATAFLGASTPVEHVTSIMSRLRPDAVAVSCNISLYFSGVTRLVDAAHRQGIPVMAGGRALGNDPKRARRLGADAWSGDIDSAVSILRGWQHDRPEIPSEPTQFDPAAMLLQVSASEIAASALSFLAKAFPPLESFEPDQLDRTREDLACITRFAAAARLVDDVTVLTEMLDWLRMLLAGRGVPPSAVAAGLEVLAPLIGRIDPQAAQYALDAIN